MNRTIQQTEKTIFSDKWHLYELEKIVHDFETDVAQYVNGQHPLYAHDYLNILLRMSGKVIVTMREIIVLCQNGYPDGALALARNIYEQFIQLAFFEQHKTDNDFMEYVNDYYTHYEIQRCRGLKCHWSYQNGDSQFISQVDRDYADAKKRAHHSVSGEYWWARVRSFSDLCKNVIDHESADTDMSKLLHKLHYEYKRACAATHASCMGNSLRIGFEVDGSLIDTSPNYDKQAFALGYATASLIYIVCIICERLGIDYSIHKAKFNRLALIYQKEEQ